MHHLSISGPFHVRVSASNRSPVNISVKDSQYGSMREKHYLYKNEKMVLYIYSMRFSLQFYISSLLNVLLLSCFSMQSNFSICNEQVSEHFGFELPDVRLKRTAIVSVDEPLRKAARLSRIGCSTFGFGLHCNLSARGRHLACSPETALLFLASWTRHLAGQDVFI